MARPTSTGVAIVRDPITVFVFAVAGLRKGV